MVVFTLERLRTCNCSVRKAGCFHSLRLVQKSQRLPGLPSVCVGRLKKLGSDASSNRLEKLMSKVDTIARYTSEAKGSSHEAKAFL